MLRPESWFAESGVSAVGDCVELNLEELDLAGAFQVMDLGEVRVSTYVRRAGFGRVMGRFQFSKGATFNLFVAGESRPIGVTGQHPFWSADRNAWVSVRDLRIGERVQVEGGTRVVEKVEVRGEEVVFNIEVEGEHCYRVGEQGVLVHNASHVFAKCYKMPTVKHDRDYQIRACGLQEYTIKGNGLSKCADAVEGDAAVDCKSLRKPKSSPQNDTAPIFIIDKYSADELIGLAIYQAIIKDPCSGIKRLIIRVETVQQVPFWKGLGFSLTIPFAVEVVP